MQGWKLLCRRSSYYDLLFFHSYRSVGWEGYLDIVRLIMAQCSPFLDYCYGPIVVQISLIYMQMIISKSLSPFVTNTISLISESYTCSELYYILFKTVPRFVLIPLFSRITFVVYYFNQFGSKLNQSRGRTSPELLI